MLVLLLILACVLLQFSLIYNFIQYYKIKKLRVEPTPTYDCSELLHDMLSGHALVRVERVSPENVFLKHSK